MNSIQVRNITVELQSLGVKIPHACPGRKGGAGPAEGQVIIFAGRALSVPTLSTYVTESPYLIKKADGSLMLFRNTEPMGEVTLPPRPKFYELKTPEGHSFSHIALLHGTDCLASTVYQDCIHRNTDNACKFCGIEISLADGNTILEKGPEVLGQVAERAMMLDGAAHVTLTTGERLHEKKTIEHLQQCVKSIKKHTRLPVHVQISPPGKTDYLVSLKEAGTDTIGIHIETFDPAARKRIAPAKHAIGIAKYTDAWKNAVSIFGKNQVSSFLIAGFDEALNSLLEGAEALCSMGVFPYLLPFRPIPGTLLEGLRPPPPETMFYLYEKVGSILINHGLASKASKAGCVRCGACSSVGLFEQLVLKTDC